MFDEDQIFMKTLQSQGDFSSIRAEPLQQPIDMEIPTVYTSSMITQRFWNLNPFMELENMF